MSADPTTPDTVVSHNSSDAPAPDAAAAPGPLKSLLFTVILLLGIGGCVEGAARVLISDDNEHATQVRKIEDSYRTNDESMFIIDPILQWRPKPNYQTEYKYLISLNPMQAVEQTYGVKLNGHGFRGADIDEPKEKLRIVCLGDSVTFGLNSPDEFAYPAILQQRLDAAAPGRVEVINAGVPSYSSDHGVIWLEEVVLPLEPDLVILGYGHNDSWMHPEELRIFMSEREQGSVARARKLLNHSAAYRAYKKALLQAKQQVQASNTVPDDTRALKTYTNYEHMLTAARDADVPALVLALYNQRSDTVAQLQKATEDFNVQLIDVRPTFQQLEQRGTAVMSEEKHPNTRGYGVMGVIIAQYAAQALGLPQPPPMSASSTAPAGA